jgi:hypothetical protein
MKISESALILCLCLFNNVLLVDPLVLHERLEFRNRQNSWWNHEDT